MAHRRIVIDSSDESETDSSIQSFPVTIITPTPNITEKPIQCPYCNKFYKNNKSLNQHLTKLHSLSGDIPTGSRPTWDIHRDTIHRSSSRITRTPAREPNTSTTATPAPTPPKMQAPRKKVPSKSLTNSSSTTQDRTRRKRQVPEALPEEDEEESLVEVFLSKRTIPTANDNFDSLIGLTEEKDNLIMKCLVPRMKEKAFPAKHRPPSRILLSGPPGTGKTSIAKCVAAELGYGFLLVTVTDVSSPWYGMGNKLVRALFSATQREPQTVVVMDEIDSIAHQAGRAEGGPSGERVTQLLNSLDTLLNTPMIFMATTNIAEHLEEALVSRFTLHITTRLPNKQERIEFLQTGSEDINNDLTPEEWKKVGAMTKGKAQRNLLNLIEEAIEEALREIVPSVIEPNWRQTLKNLDISAPPTLKLKHFQKAMERFYSMSISKDNKSSYTTPKKCNFHGCNKEFTNTHNEAEHYQAKHKHQLTTDQTLWCRQVLFRK